jgi:hypothetical protein
MIKPASLLAIAIASYLLVPAAPAAADTTHQSSKAMYCAQEGAPPSPGCLELLEATVVDEDNGFAPPGKFSGRVSRPTGQPDPHHHWMGGTRVHR